MSGQISPGCPRLKQPVDRPAPVLDVGGLKCGTQPYSPVPQQPGRGAVQCGSADLMLSEDLLGGLNGPTLCCKIDEIDREQRPGHVVMVELH